MKPSEWLENYKQKNPGHAPVNPLTGMPNGVATSADAGSGAASGPGANAGTDPGAAAGPSAGPSADADPSAGAAAGGPGFATAAGTPSAAAPQAGFSSAPDAHDIPVSAPYAPAPTSAEVDNLFDRFRALTDNRVVATVALLLLLLALVGVQNPLVFAVLLVGGYMLIDHFVAVRRALTLGGISWALIIFIGVLVEDRVGPVVTSMSFLFALLGFLVAISACCVYFVGRSLYYYGYRRGQQQADHVISQHIENRLIEHPEDWGELDGDFLEVEGSLNRVREKERTAEQALRDESGRKDDLVTYLAHDLKTPLASVVGYLSLLQEAPDLPEEQRVRFTGVALEKAHRLDALIEEFFDITRFDFHDIVLTRGYVDLGLMLAQVADEFYPTLAEQGKSVEVEVPESITALVDGDKMARVFNNVMKNAIAYSYEGSVIRVSAVREVGDVVVRFENQGDPIPAAKLNVIFEKFYRLDAARATNRGGAGLGLAIAKEIVTAHGGTISCESTPEHTIFTIVLPES